MSGSSRRAIPVRAREVLAYFLRNPKALDSLEDVARYYRTYAELMDHWNAVLPGKILRVDTLFPDHEVKITIWTSDQARPSLAKVEHVELKDVLGIAR